MKSQMVGERRACGWQVYPKLFLNGGSMYDTAWWRWLVAIWEALVYNPLIDLGACYQVGLNPNRRLLDNA